MIAQIDSVVLMHEIIFQEVHLNVALVEATQSTESTRTLCRSLQAILLGMAKLGASKLALVCTTKAINTVVQVGVPNHGSVNRQELQHHGNDKTAGARTMALKIKAAPLLHGPQLLVGMVLPLVPVLLLGNKPHHPEVTITATRATLLLAMITVLVAMVLLLRPRD